ncbi:hypothetical protein AJ79_01894 [Helicocarpus griseus UAMH5409]|uniref:Ubiquitinyl hydrolase 1 n=1 Tax=Helicocarpus griseus UAMH5409 TaxID=1447875 RepID=A0A2B7Y649_9EURO|nr:hypothetical protein AJ79_01894 [Helicocarpus griseus UAMH5409]
MMAEVLPVKTDLTTEEQVHFTWRLPNWTELGKVEHSPKFECGGSKWQIVVHPYGNNSNEHLSIYLKHGYEEGEMPDHWNTPVQFALVLWNTNDPSAYIAKDANHRFSADQDDWGFTKFRDLRRLLGYLGDRPSLLGNEEANITAYVRVIKDDTGVLWHSFYNYDSKKTTGLVGLKNLGATGYLNVILQCFYFTNAFRKVVYQLPLNDVSKKNTLLWALQRLFYSLQSDDKPVSALELTRAMGWGPRHLFMQQDVCEMIRVLQEQFEHAPEASSLETKLTDIFCGKMKSSVIVKGDEQSRLEHFLDISLNVQNISSLEESFRDYISENSNEEQAAEGVPKTKSGVTLESFPPVLHLHLKRYAYNMSQRQMVKVNDRFSYPEEFDASPYLSPDADMSEPWIYRLTGVVVHSGGMLGGRYWVFLRPTPNGAFFKLDDDRVTRAMLKNVIEGNYGGEEQTTNAYMLVYMRKSRINDILAAVTDADVPAYIKTQLAEDREAAERLRKEMEDQHYINIGLISTSSFCNHSGFDLTSSNLDHSDTSSLIPIRVRKETTIRQLGRQIGEKLQLDPERITLWICINRQNGTCRPYEPLLCPEFTAIEKACRDAGCKENKANIWVEVSPGEAGLSRPPLPQVTIGGDVLLIFIKNFDVVKQTLRGVGSIYISKGARVGPSILKAMGWSEGTRFSVHEEVKPAMILNVDPNTTFQQAELGNGDILCVQKMVKRDELPSNLKARDVTQYFDNLRNERNKQLYS